MGADHGHRDESLDALRFALAPERGRAARGLAALREIASHPRQAFAILRSRLAGKRLRARQALIALLGADHGGLWRSTRGLPAADGSSVSAERVATVTAAMLREGSVPSAAIIILVAPGHVLVDGAVDRLADAFAADPGLQILYGDALFVPAGADGRCLPLLRPAFDPEYLLAVDYIGPVIAIRREALQGVGGIVDAPLGAEAMDLVLRCADRFGRRAVRHLPQPLSLWQPARDPDAPRVAGSARASLWVAASAAGPLSYGERGVPHPESSLPSPQPSPPGRGSSSRVPPAAAIPRPDEEGAGIRSARLEAARRHLARIGEAAEVEVSGEGIVSVIRPLPEPRPLVSLIVPTRDRLDLLRPCIESLQNRTDWPAREILICDNDSRDPATRAYLRALEAGEIARVIACPGPFNFAAMNNVAARQGRGRLLAFINNDVEAFQPDWLERLCREALRPAIGAVGAKLLDREGRIQHAGIVLGTGGLVTHGHRHFPADAPGYLAGLLATREVSAVTAACLVVEAEKFAAIGGFDEKTFAIDFNDVDLCLRLNAAGYRTLLVPSAVLHHREAASRRWTPEARARHEDEVAALKKRWGSLLAQDPHYHPGFDPDLGTYARLRRDWTAGIATGLR